ncbi:MAG: phosphate ABC transporter permease subunit PstC [Bacteroidetes bacterium]|nr:MAG: phosphate ABC transporter permease subunit PstC [Bacteroidota bacterium]
MKRFFRRFIEKFIEGIFFLSSSVTTLTVLLIVVFLFREGMGVFNKTPIEEGFAIALNKNNSVKEISSLDMKNIFDQNITNWKTLGGNNDSIILFRIDDISNYFTDEQLGDSLQYVPKCISSLVDSLTGIIAFIPEKYIDKHFAGRKLPMDKISVGKFLSGKEWFPTAQPASQLGVLPLILGTLWVSLMAILIALPLGLATAIYMAEIASEKVRRILKPLIELLAGIPSVVYGFFGLIVIVPLIQKVFDLPVGETGLAGSIVLGIMALPTIITISEDAIRTTPRAMKEASLALGANKWQTIARVIIPYSMSGITAAAILGIGRAIGETMAVLMVTGNAAVIPHTILEPVRTIPATIAAELGEAPQGGLHYEALFALGCILFILTMATNLLVEYISKKRKYNKQ